MADNIYKPPEADTSATTEASAAGLKPRLFLYSLAVPVIWVSLGVVVSLVSPETRLGTAGTIGVLLVSVSLASWLTARRCNRGFIEKEGLKFGFYCWGWMVLFETLSILSVLFLTDSSAMIGSANAQQILLISLPITYAVNALLIWVAVSRFAPIIAKNYLEKHGQNKS